MLGLFGDKSYVKVTKENWDKIEELFEQKEKRIKEQETIIAEQKAIIAEMTETTSKLIKYKENDDLLFAYENQVKADAKKIKALSSQVAELEKAVEQADKKIQAVLSLESAYLQKIIETESKLRRSASPCPEYETRGDRLIEIYA